MHEAERGSRISIALAVQIFTLVALLAQICHLRSAIVLPCAPSYLESDVVNGLISATSAGSSLVVKGVNRQSAQQIVSQTYS